jgi:hypothetical protein
VRGGSLDDFDVVLDLFDHIAVVLGIVVNPKANVLEVFAGLANFSQMNYFYIALF